MSGKYSLPASKLLLTFMLPLILASCRANEDPLEPHVDHLEQLHTEAEAVLAAAPPATRPMIWSSENDAERILVVEIEVGGYAEQMRIALRSAPEDMLFRTESDGQLPIGGGGSYSRNTFGEIASTGQYFEMMFDIGTGPFYDSGVVLSANYWSGAGDQVVRLETVVPVLWGQWQEFPVSGDGMVRTHFESAAREVQK